MKFSEMPYTRPELDDMIATVKRLTEALKAAVTYEEARAVFIEMDQEERHVMTQSTLASIRHSIDTRVEYYKEEYKYWNQALPQLQEYQQQWTLALMESPFRKDFEEEFGTILFVNAELELKSFSPEIIPELQQENDLAQEYENLLASAQIPFKDGVYTLSQMTPFKNSIDDEERLASAHLLTFAHTNFHQLPTGLWRDGHIGLSLQLCAELHRQDDVGLLNGQCFKR